MGGLIDRATLGDLDHISQLLECHGLPPLQKSKKTVPNGKSMLKRQTARKSPPALETFSNLLNVIIGTVF